MTIKFEITMTNKWLYSLIAVGIFLALGVGVWAYNSEGPPSVMGHSAEELEVNVSGTLMNLQQAIDQGNLSSGWKHVGAVLYNQQVPNSRWNILDLSSYVGSKNSLVMFKAYSSHASSCATIQNPLLTDFVGTVDSNDDFDLKLSYNILFEEGSG
jgi:hypothetical protein